MSNLNILIAIPYCDEQTLEYIKEHKEIRFLLDSGAFTAWKAGKEMTLKTYCDFLENLSFKPWRYFTLDKIGDSQGTKENFEALLKMGHKPIPIFTRGEKLEELEYYYEHSDVVALGGLVGTRGNKGFVKSLMGKIAGRKTHWLGFTQNDFISTYKPFSCDSSGWSGAVRYGRISLYLGRGRWTSVTKLDFLQRPPTELIKIFNEYDEDPAAFARKEGWVNGGTWNSILKRITCKSWVKFQIEVEQYLGTKFFLACGNCQDMSDMGEAYAFWMKKTNQVTGLKTITKKPRLLEARA